MTNLIKKIAKPLFDELPITYFAMATVHADGSYQTLCSDTKWAKHYFQHGYQNLELNFALLDEMNIEYFRWSSLCRFRDDPLFTNLLADLNQFGYVDGMTILHKGPELYDVYSFAVADLNHFKKVSRSVHALKQFILYFKEQLFKNEKLLNAYQQRHIIDIAESKNISDVHGYSFDMPIARIHFAAGHVEHYLTRREFDCMHYLLKGMSAKLIADTLNISIKTIEEYIANIKRKLNIRSTSELITLLSENSFINLLRDKYYPEQG